MSYLYCLGLIVCFTGQKQRVVVLEFVMNLLISLKEIGWIQIYNIPSRKVRQYLQNYFFHSYIANESIILLKIMQRQPIQLPASLVKYEPPMPVTSKHTLQQIASNQVRQGKAQLRDLLNILLPPRTFTIPQAQTQKSITYVQYVDGDRLKRQDVDILKEKLEGFLNVRKARDKPICPIREKIFAEAFEEIIRQVLIDCPERGVMLGRVKNELYLTVAAYRTLYEESLVFSKSKISSQQNDLTQLQTQEKELLQKQHQLHQKQIYLLSKKQSLQQKAREIKTIYREKRQHELRELNLQQQGLTKFLLEMGRMPGMSQNNTEEQIVKQGGTIESDQDQ